MTKCKGCGAEIGFIKLKAGKVIPVNPWPVYIEDKTAKDIIITVDGRVSNGRRENVRSTNADLMRGYVSHFATCPMAGLSENDDQQAKFVSGTIFILSALSRYFA